MKIEEFSIASPGDWRDQRKSHRIDATLNPAEGQSASGQTAAYADCAPPPKSVSLPCRPTARAL
ncbi:hypothetical protein CHELA1G11_10727 [Hyphomicrobiales bacterium]|nr:hypothetical protein CHELA1G11_10727 [Hyphomicrobiales bacterium]CAH1672662.1 hypothetical protein CHELA1G2_13578 [Hyphomicrobiales bacterium]